MIQEIRDGLCYDDVLLVPQYSTIESRSKINISVEWGGLQFEHPIVPANMSHVVGEEMAIEIIESGGLAILHRFMEPLKQIRISDKITNECGNEHFAVSIGVKPSDREIVGSFWKAGVRLMCIDIAHGDSEHCINMIKWTKDKYPDIFLIAGNVATGMGAERLWRAGTDVVKVGVGPGCFAAGTRILMSNGFYKNIEDVKAGDYVINMNGKPVKVLNAFCTGTRKVAKLRTNVFYEDTYVTPDHRMWVGDLNSVSKTTLSSGGYSKHLDRLSKTTPKQSKYKWKEIGVVQQDVLLLPKTVGFNLPETFEIALSKRMGGNWRIGHAYEQDSIITPSYDSGYLFGTFIGDGCASCTEHKGSHIGAVRWYFGHHEKDIAEKLARCIKNIFDKESSIEMKEKTLDVTFYYKPLADFLHTFGKKINKHLPEELLVSNKEYLRGLWDGLIDSDGCIEKDGRIGFTNTSMRAVELANILNYLLTGSFPNSDKEEPTAGGLIGCNVENCHPSYQCRPLKRAHYRHASNYQVVKILGYEECNIEMPVYDLTVDCETHSFIANNMIVHNSLCSTRIETGNGAPQLTALMEVAEAKKALTTPYTDRVWDKADPGKYQIVDMPVPIQRPIYIMADGGIKSAGDVVKSLCFADMTMVGNLFAGCVETPGNRVKIDGTTYKEYAGSSTHKATHVEGVSALVKTTGTYKSVLDKLLQGLRSGCSYQGAYNLQELRERPHFIKISGAGLRESHPHDVLIK